MTRRHVYTTPAARIAELVAEHGSYRNAAKAIGISYPYLHRVASGNKEAGEGLLKKLGLRAETKFLCIVSR